jgi:hypothetical protein
LHADILAESPHYAAGARDLEIGLQKAGQADAPTGT